MSATSTGRRLRAFAEGRRLLLVASTGGHLAELDKLTSMLRPSDTSHWVSFDNEQSRSLLERRPHTFVPYVAPRDVRGAARAYCAIWRLARETRFDGVLSTGAAVGVSAMLAARIHRIDAAYVETLARLDGPSMTGSLVARIPGVQTYTQHPNWASKAWPYELSIIDSWHAERRERFTPRRIFVTVGTISPYTFDRLVDRVLSIVPEGVEIRWQLGDSMRPGISGAVSMLDSSDFADSLAWADVVVTHAGVGNILGAMSAGASTVVVPRRAAFDEHVDDHQLQIAEEMSSRGLAIMRDAGDLTWDDLCEATRTTPRAATHRPLN